MKPLVVNPGGLLGVEDIVGREQEIRRYYYLTLDSHEGAMVHDFRWSVVRRRWRRNRL
jgi:hypothetical protein